MIERFTRIVVLTSAFVAAAWELDLGAQDWPPLLPVGIALFIVLTLAAARWGRSIVIALSAAGYIAPLTLLAAAGRFRAPLLAAWLLPMLGAVVTTAKSGRWSFPARWKVPLTFWALVVALSWPLIVWRESDFYLRLFHQAIPLNGLGNSPANAGAWTMSVALTHLVGLLWFDWLCSHYADDPERFALDVTQPFAVAAFIAVTVAVYQGLFDVTWLSGGQWGAINRAGGSLIDGNPSGMLAALWSTLFLGFAFSPSVRSRVLGLAGVPASWIAVAASGSRMALLAAFIGAMTVAASVIRTRRHQGGSPVSWRLVAAIGCAGFLAVGAATFALRTTGVTSRIRAALPSADGASIRYFLRYQLWDRNGPYGTAALYMIRDSPLVGVGVGAFHTLVPDYSYPLQKFITRSDPDNSQNWFRHQLAELGLIGSIGWVAWTIALARLLWSAPPAGRSEAAVKGALFALGVVSLFAMPTQNTILALAFWTIAFWWIALAAPHALTSHGTSPTPARWLGVVGLTVVFVALTVCEGEGALRPEMRAVRFDWPYSYGFYAVEREPDGRPFRWAQARAVDVMPAQTRWLRVTAWVNHADVAAKPVDIKIWCNRDLVIDTRLLNTRPVIALVRVPDGDKRVALRTWSSRIVKPLDYGVPDDRELGLIVRSEFVPSPAAELSNR